ncbi:MAG: hypothetical protein WBA00_13470 [Rhodococcus sp. (in: high G+C Gram-positive bacteria)]
MKRSVSATLLSKSDIAALAKVQRPVVTVWISRYRTSDQPFPKAVDRIGRQERYDGHQVVHWLQTRGLGNNPTLDEDLALYAVLDHRSDLSDEVVFEGVGALLCMKWYLGAQLTDYSGEELLDEADELDPDNEFLYSEVAALGSRIDVFADHVDRMADAAFGAGNAFEALMSQRFRPHLSGFADSAIDPAGLQLCAAVVIALTDPERHVYIDPSGGCSDLMVTLRRAFPENAEPASVVQEASSSASRLGRRRLTVHGWTRLIPPADGFVPGYEIEGPSAFVVRYPSPATIDYTDTQILTAIDDIVMQMSDDHLAVVLAPASALIDRQRDPAAARLRSDILRSDRVRAIVRLPEGLMPSRPGTALALWVLGSASGEIRPADRWSVVVDVGSRELDDATTNGLVSDVLAAMGDWKSIRGHAFQFGALTKTSVLLAEDKRGLSPARIRKPRVKRIGADLAADVLMHSDAIRRSQLELRRKVRLPGVEYRVDDGCPMPTLGQLAASRELMVLGGHRIEPEHVVVGGAVRVLGLDEVLGDVAIGRRGMDRLVFTAAYPSARYTEPGDIVFCSGARFGAVVDHEGSSVVVFPARVIRIADASSSGLIPDVIAAHLNASGLDSRAPRAIRSSATWKRWEIPRVTADHAAATIDVVDSLRQQRETTLQLLGHIEQLTNTLVDGLAHGVLAIGDRSEPLQERPARNAS